MKKLIAILTLVFTLCTVNLCCPVWAAETTPIVLKAVDDNGVEKTTGTVILEINKDGDTCNVTIEDSDKKELGKTAFKFSEFVKEKTSTFKIDEKITVVVELTDAESRKIKIKVSGSMNGEGEGIVPEPEPAKSADPDSQAPEEEQTSGLGGILPIAAAVLSFIAAVCSVICLIKVSAVANYAKQIIENQGESIDVLESKFSKAANQICESCGKINSNVNKVWECLLNTAPSAAAFQPSQPVEPPRPKTPEEQIDDALTNGVSLEILGMKPVEITYQSGMYFLKQTASKLFYRKDLSDGTVSIYPGSKIRDPAWSNRYDEYFDTIRLGSSGKIHVVSPVVFYLNTNSGVTELSQKGRVEIN